MEKLQLAIALIRSTETGALRWLATNGRESRKLQFVVGDRLESESFRETVAREVAWSLDLERKRDFLVSNMAQMNLEFIDQLPGWSDQCHVHLAFYNMEVYRRDVMKQLNADSTVFWIDSGEVCDGVTRQGQILDPLIPYLVNRSNVIQHWESSER